MKEKWPDKTDFLTGFEIKPSNKIIIAKIKKVSKFRLYVLLGLCFSASVFEQTITLKTQLFFSSFQGFLSLFCQKSSIS